MTPAAFTTSACHVQFSCDSVPLERLRHKFSPSRFTDAAKACVLKCLINERRVIIRSGQPEIADLCRPLLKQLIIILAVVGGGLCANVAPSFAAQSAGSFRIESQPPLQEPRNSRLKLYWKSLTEGRLSASEIQNSQYVSFFLGTKAKYRFTENFQFLLNARLRLRSETTQSLFERKDAGNQVYLYEGLMRWKPFDFLRFDMGAVNMRYLDAPLLVTDQPFLGIRETLGWGSEQFRVNFHFLQAVPTSRTFSSQNVEIESTPSFTSETLKLSVRPHRRFLAKGHVTHFAYNDLPGAVALESRIYGNSVPPTTGRYGQFSYGFDGFETGGEIDILLSRALKTSAGLSYLKNNEAPDKLNRGQIVFGELTWRMKDGVYLIPRYSTFINQSDTSPAYYNSEIYGHNDRVGERIDLGLLLKNFGWKVTATYVDSQSIHKDPLEPSQQFYWIQLETSYAEL